MVISNASVNSEYCLKEIIFAKKRKKPILGLHLENVTLPDQIDFMLGDIQQLFVDEAGGLESTVGLIAQGLREQILKNRREAS